MIKSELIALLAERHPELTHARAEEAVNMVLDGITAALEGDASVTMQLHSSDAACFSATLTDVKKNTLVFFKGKN